uniref:Secreted protein n=2 Tax=Caenorhabditis tropicalis TaxID=1561998 RepID=A0A1I7UY49_9PELO
MLFILLLASTFFHFSSSNFVNFGDGRKVPFISVVTEFKNETLSVTTSWMIRRDCDQYVRKDVTKSRKGQLIETKSTCIHRKESVLFLYRIQCIYTFRCGLGSGGPPPDVPITCDVFVKNW